MNEKVVTFGKGNNLVGILTEPEKRQQIEDAPGILILNSGMLHHVGPFRLHVLTARRLAACGYTVFRFDVAGMGDSTAHNDSGYDADRTIADIRCAMDELTDRKGTKHFVLMGLCTGANNAHKVAVIDKRVKGCIFLGGYAYPTWQFYIRRYGPIALDPKRAINIVLRLARNLLSKSETDEKEAPTSDGFHWWALPPKDKTRMDFITLVDRSVYLLFVFSGGEIERYNYKNQMEHAFWSVDFKGQLKVLINNDAHHTYVMAVDRDKLMNEIIEWLDECYADTAN